MRRAQCLEIGIEGGLILRDGEQIVGLFVLDRKSRGFALSMQGIGSDDPAVDLKGPEQGFDLGDLALGDGDALALEEGAEQMHPGAVYAHGPAQALAVDGHDLAGFLGLEQSFSRDSVALMAGNDLVPERTRARSDRMEMLKDLARPLLMDDIAWYDELVPDGEAPG